MNEQLAYAQLRLKNLECPSIEEIRTAYNRMIQRYPANLFPDKFRDIQFSYDYLMSNEDYWKVIIEDEMITIPSFSKTSLLKLPVLESDEVFLSQTVAPVLKKIILSDSSS